MANLNTTVDNIQWRSDMLTSGKLAEMTTDEAKAAAWTDQTYPSAKAVADKINAIAPGKIEHPVGSVLITSTNADPAASVGGTWTLIDKEFKNEMVALSANVPVWAAGRANITSGYIIRADHSTRLKLVLTTNDSLSSSGGALGTISPTLAGARSDIPRLAFGVNDLVTGIVQAASSDGTKVFNIQYSINTNGVITITKVFNNETVPAGTVIDLTVYVPMVQDFMADNYCDKFYWKRTK